MMVRVSNTILLLLSEYIKSDDLILMKTDQYIQIIDAWF